MSETPIQELQEVKTVIVLAEDLPPALQEIAAKRGWQTLWVGLVVSVVLSVLQVVASLIWGLDGWDSLWTLLKLAAASGIAAVFQYFYRLKVDYSGYNPDGTPIVYVEEPDELDIDFFE